MNSYNKTFIFEGYNLDLKGGKALFKYSIQDQSQKLTFTEKIFFASVTASIPKALLNSILNNLMLILGISYWKLYCPKEIVIESNFLTKEQAEFWDTIYAKGLGEFFFKNRIDFRELVQFPFIENAQSPVSYPRKDRALLGLGGGKDSIVAGELLRSQNKPFDVFTVGTSLIQEQVAKIMKKNPIVIMRYLDPKLFELNKTSSVYNGHVPISIIYAFLGLIASILYDYSLIIVGNEKSANYGNVEYLGEMINHQWSKSEEFEKLFNDYVRKFITSDVIYSSSLRNMSELEVVREFTKYPKYFKVFSSCNNNFKILKPIQSDNARWCGNCAKCLFVFTLLAAFLPKEQVLDIFGKNLFEDKNLLELFKELLGLKDVKPFECVGTPEEVKEALLEIARKKEFNGTKLMKFFKTYEA